MKSILDNCQPDTACQPDDTPSGQLACISAGQGVAQYQGTRAYFEIEAAFSCFYLMKV